ncbi:MAG: aldose 1-epimerase [Acidimicrobiales bacterium]
MATEPLADGSVLVSTIDGVAAVSLSAGSTQFSVMPELGLVGASLTHKGRSFLDFRGGAVARRGHTTGLPVLSPWANRLSSSTYRVGSRTVNLSEVPIHRDGNGLPIHGMLVGRPGWELVSVKSQSNSASMIAKFNAGADEEIMAGFPFPHELLVGFTVTPGRLMVSTTLSATGRRSVPVSFGWHPYFCLPDSERTRIRLGMPARHRMILDERGIPTGEEERQSASISRLGDQLFDDAYRLGRDRQMLLASGRRRLTVVFDKNFPFAQIYSPVGSDFVAIEPMTSPINALGAGTTPMVAPGERFTARFVISLT